MSSSFLSRSAAQKPGRTKTRPGSHHRFLKGCFEQWGKHEEGLALAGLAFPGFCLALAFSAGRFVVPATARLSEHAILLNLAVETLQGGFERLIFTNPDFGHWLSSSPDPNLGGFWLGEEKP
jgi:hypothetical protein